MNRTRRLFAIIALATAIAACSQGVSSLGDVPSAPQLAVPSLATTVASTSPISDSIETSSPTEPATDPATVLAADGIGPYVIGARLSDLQSQTLITNIEPSFHCDDSWQHAEATGRYAGLLTVTFYLGRLIDLHTNSTQLVTPSGARVGMPLTELQSIYGSRGTLIAGVTGNHGMSVRMPDTDLGIVFFLDETGTTTRSMSGGKVQPLEAAAVALEGC